jgi:hypothetical protein
MKLKNLVTKLLATAALAAASSALAITINRTTDVTGIETWYATNTYILQTVVYVQSNAVLTIEPGTVIKGATNTATLLPRTGIPNLVSALWVTRGGKLYATGTVAQPIIFTFEGDDVNNPNDIPPTVTGQWGGIVMCGRGQINSAQDAGGQAANPKYEVFEGTTGAGAVLEHVFGGNDDTDNSGALRFVSIRHPGNVFASAKELNGLTMGAVGSGTLIEYVEVFASSDDGFEWWGGTVNTKYLIAAFCEDDDFDTDQGYRGTNQFWFGIKPPWAGSTDSRGFETDGDLDQTGYPGGNATPYSAWAVYNATMIGRGKGNSSFGGGNCWNSRDEARPNVFNSVFTEFNQGLKVDSDGLNEFVTGVATMKNCILNVASNATTANAAFVMTNNNSQVDPLIGGISYTNYPVGGLDPRPTATSPLLAGAMAGAPLPVSYRGAFNGNERWMHGWSGLARLGYLEAGNFTQAPDYLGMVVSGANLLVSYPASSVGYTYQLQSSTSESPPYVWVNEGSPVAGNGGVITFTVPNTPAPPAGESDIKMFRLLQY